MYQYVDDGCLHNIFLLRSQQYLVYWVVGPRSQLKMRRTITRELATLGCDLLAYLHIPSYLLPLLPYPPPDNDGEGTRLRILCLSIQYACHAALHVCTQCIIMYVCVLCTLYAPVSACPPPPTVVTW